MNTTKLIILDQQQVEIYSAHNSQRHKTRVVKNVREAKTNLNKKPVQLVLVMYCGQQKNKRRNRIRQEEGEMIFTKQILSLLFWSCYFFICIQDENLKEKKSGDFVNKVILKYEC